MSIQAKFEEAMRRLEVPLVVDIEPRKQFINYKMAPKYVTAHNAASPWGAKSLHNYNRRSIATSMDGVKSWHLSAGQDGVYQALALTENAWHAGDGDGPGNMLSVAVEIANDLSPDVEAYKIAEANGAKALASALYAVGLTAATGLKKHQDWSGKYCPHRILRENRWEQFAGVVEEYGQVILGKDVEVHHTEPILQKTEKQVAFTRVQIGSFPTREEAEVYKQKMEKRLGMMLTIRTAFVFGRTWHRVQVGAFTQVENAYKFAHDLEQQGIKTWVIPAA